MLLAVNRDQSDYMDAPCADPEGVMGGGGGGSGPTSIFQSMSFEMVNLCRTHSQSGLKLDPTPPP